MLHNVMRVTKPIFRAAAAAVAGWGRRFGLQYFAQFMKDYFFTVGQVSLKGYVVQVSI